MRLRAVLLSLALIACNAHCGRPGHGPGGPRPGASGSTPDEADPGDPVVEAPGAQSPDHPGSGEAPAAAGAPDAAFAAPVDPAGVDAPVDPAVEEEGGQSTGSGGEEEAIAKLGFKKVPKIPSFSPGESQDVAAPEELEYLTDHERTEKILAEADWAKVEGEKTLVPMVRVRKVDGTSYRFRILLDAGEGKIITGFFKPRQKNYWDWLKEIHAYNIGRRIEAPTVPTVMRFMPKQKFSFFLAKITKDLQDNFKWEGKKEDTLRGAFKYWVPSYKHRTFGKRIIDEDYMTEIAKSLHPANKEELREGFGLYLELGRGIVFDYLVINEDRPENLGTILMPDGSYHVVLIDNGLALGVEHAGRTVMKDIFKQMRIFPRDMIEALETLEEGEVEKMLRPEDDKVMMLPEVCVKQFLKRRKFLLDTVDQYHQKYGDVIWY